MKLICLCSQRVSSLLHLVSFIEKIILPCLILTTMVPAAPLVLSRTHHVVVLVHCTAIDGCSDEQRCTPCHMGNYYLVLS